MWPHNLSIPVRIARLPATVKLNNRKLSLKQSATQKTPSLTTHKTCWCCTLCLLSEYVNILSPICHKRRKERQEKSTHSHKHKHVSARSLLLLQCGDHIMYMYVYLVWREIEKELANNVFIHVNGTCLSHTVHVGIQNSKLRSKGNFAIALGTSLLRTQLGPHEVSRLKRCPRFRGCFVHFSM